MRLTKRFMDWYQGNNDKEKETPAGGIKRVGYVLWNYVGRLVVVNMLFLLCCIPIVTIPAALAALNRYLLGIYRVGYGFSLEDYWKEFKSGILKNLPAGLLTGGLGFYAYYLMSLAGNFERGTTHDVLIGCGMGVMIFAILIGAYYFVMSAMLDLGAGALLKNTLILMTVEWKMSIVIVVTVVIAGGILLALAPYSLFLLLTIGVSFPQMLVYACVNRAVERRILQPFERQNGGVAEK